jgi:putative ABC transport system permease protein
LGRKIQVGAASGGFAKSPFREVVGVVGDVAQYGLGLPATPQIYMPHSQFSTRYLTFVLRTEGDPEILAQPLQQTVFAVDPELPLSDIKSLESIVANTIGPRRVSLWLLGVFALSALLLAAIGIYGVVSYSVARRTSEFGIRLALGARPIEILWDALRESMAMLIAGLSVGITASLAISRLVANFLFDVSATDVSTFVALPLFLAIIALASCYLAARRATKVDPLTALRYE